MLITGVDIETTGLDQEKGHRIIEIAMLRYDLDTRKLVDKLVQRINPERPIDPGAQDVHGICFADLISCPKWEEVAPSVTAFMGGSDVMVAHNTGFDAPFIGLELLRIGLEVPDILFIDTLDARWATPYGKSPKLGELCFALDIPYDPTLAHGAEYDIERTMTCFFSGYDRGFYSLPDELLALKAA